MTISKQCALTPILFLLSFSAIAAPRLDLSTTVNYPCVVTSVALSNDAPQTSYDPLAGVQFDLNYDAAQFSVSTWSTGAAAAQQRLDVNGAYATGTLRVLLYPNGLGAAVEGELFKATFCRKAGASQLAATFQLGAPVTGNVAAVLVAGTLAGSPQTIDWGPDTDGDGFPNNYDDDDDNDGMPDWYEIQYGFDPLNPADGAQDFDGDGVSNYDEYRYGLNPKLADSDGDGVPDKEEIVQINAVLVIINSLLLN